MWYVIAVMFTVILIVGTVAYAQGLFTSEPTEVPGNVRVEPTPTIMAPVDPTSTIPLPTPTPSDEPNPEAEVVYTVELYTDPEMTQPLTSLDFDYIPTLGSDAVFVWVRPVRTVNGFSETEFEEMSLEWSDDLAWGDVVNDNEEVAEEIVGPSLIELTVVATDFDEDLPLDNPYLITFIAEPADLD